MGKFSPKRLAGVWEKYKEECMSLAETHQWTSEQLVEVKIALDALPDQSSLRLWEEVVDRNIRESGFIRRQLHRKVRI
ncbi:MAG: hypothetical protein WAJ82_00355 [Azonexus sp.]